MPSQEASHAGLAGGGQQLSGGEADWATNKININKQRDRRKGRISKEPGEERAAGRREQITGRTIIEWTTNK